VIDLEILISHEFASGEKAGLWSLLFSINPQNLLCYLKIIIICVMT